MNRNPFDEMNQTTDLDPLRIEKSLDDLWRQYRAGEGGEMAARARLANLVCICASAEEFNTASGTIGALNAVRPVRSIIVWTEPEGSNADTRAETSLRCTLGPGAPVCYEQITITAHGHNVRAVPSVIQALTVPDLPVYLWSVGDPLSRPGLDVFAASAEHVVTDSHTFQSPLVTFRWISEQAVASRGRCVFTEMTWTRLNRWREAVGQLFDPADSRAFLPAVKRVRITSTHGVGAPSDRALLMTAWLAARLGWEPVRMDAGRGGCEFRGPNGPVTVEWREEDRSARGHLLSIELDAGDVSFAVSRNHDDPEGSLRSCIFCSGDRAEGPAHNPVHWAQYELLCRALETRSAEADWEEALAVAAGLRAL